MEKSANNNPRPNLKDRLFWDWDIAQTDWQKASRSVIARVLTRGNDEEFEELVRFYGQERIVQALKTEHVMLPNYVMDRVTGYFGLKKEELYCYQWRLGRSYTWI